jgi:membrane carboxypeptidase/penicillin-binding protein
LEGKTVAAKTGTTSQFRDAWTVGYTPSLVAGVWAGNNDNRPMKAGADGVFVAAPIWHDFMTQVLVDQPDETFVAYDTYKQNKPTELVKGDMGTTAVVTYYKSGKKISAEKAAKADQSKIEKRINYVPVDGAQQSITIKDSFSIAMPLPTDPMYKRWTNANINLQSKN